MGRTLICLACSLLCVTRSLFSTTLGTANLLLDLAPDFISPAGTPGPTSILESRRDLTAQFLTQFPHLAAQFGHFTSKVVPRPACGTAARVTTAMQFQITAHAQFQLGRTITVHQADQVAAAAEGNRLTRDITTYSGTNGQV